MSLRPTMIQLPAEVIERLDRRAARAQVSRSQLVREAITAFLAGDGEDEIARRYQEGYDRIPVGTPDAWGDLESFHDELARLRQEPPTQE